MSTILRAKLIRLAQRDPSVRDKVLPLLRKAKSNFDLSRALFETEAHLGEALALLLRSRAATVDGTLKNLLGQIVPTLTRLRTSVSDLGDGVGPGGLFARGVLASGAWDKVGVLSLLEDLAQRLRPMDRALAHALAGVRPGGAAEANLRAVSTALDALVVAVGNARETLDSGNHPGFW